MPGNETMFTPRPTFPACIWRNTVMVVLLALASLAARADTTSAPVTPTASLTLHNRSGYQMNFIAWNDGSNCSNKTPLEPGFDINSPQPKTIAIAAGKPIAVGVGIFDMTDKAPVVCDYILSFKLPANNQYLLEYDIHNRRCYGQLFRSDKGTYQMVLPGDKEDLHEKVPEFGWDQFEPGCSGE